MLELYQKVDYAKIMLDGSNYARSSIHYASILGSRIPKCYCLLLFFWITIKH